MKKQNNRKRFKKTYRGGPEYVVGNRPVFREKRGIRRAGDAPRSPRGKVQTIVKAGVVVDRARFDEIRSGFTPASSTWLFPTAR